MALTSARSGPNGYAPGPSRASRDVSGRNYDLRRQTADVEDPEEEDEDHGYPISRLRRQFTDFASSKTAEIEEQRVARHYFHSDQLTEKELKILKARGQPAVVRNFIDRKVNGIVGMMERLRQDPKAYPRTPYEEQRGGDELATSVVRYVLDKPADDGNDWASTCAECSRQAGIEGTFGIELLLDSGDTSTEEEKGSDYPWWEQAQGQDPDISYAKVDGDTFFYDPRSVKYTFSDARYMGSAKWLDVDVAIEMFPDFEEELEGMCTSGGTLESWQQQDREFRWVDVAEKRVFLIEHWYIYKGEWYFCYYVGYQMLYRGISPFRDEKGKTFCRYIMGSMNIDHDGDRYGIFRPLKPRQDEANARASKALHLLNARRIIGEKGAVADVEKARREAVRADGYLEVAPGKRFEFDDVKNAQDFQGQLQLFQEIVEEINNFGPNAANLGQDVGDKSGRAIALLQQAGLAELGPFILVFRGWKLRVYRAIWSTVMRYWKAERWIRIIDDDQKAQFIQINAQQIDEYGRPAMVNAIGQLDVDMLMDEGPDTITLMEDIFQNLLQMAQAGVQIPPDVFLELAPIAGRVKRSLMQKLQQAQQQQQPDPQIAQLQKAGMQAGVQKTQSEAARNLAEARAKQATLQGNVVKLGADAQKSRASAFREVTGSIVDMKRAANDARATSADIFHKADQGLSQLPQGRSLAMSDRAA